MSSKSRGKIVQLLLTLFINLPLWYYLVWWMLKHSDAGELQMFLFWVYVPAGVLGTIISALVSLGDD